MRRKLVGKTSLDCGHPRLRGVCGTEIEPDEAERLGMPPQEDERRAARWLAAGEGAQRLQAPRDLNFE
jgi:hypothetical protein